VNLRDLPLLTEAERHLLLVEWNKTRQEYSDRSCIHEFFERQAAVTPDAVALIHRDRRLTYRDLDSRANGLACHLESLGVGPGVLVGVCLGRGLEMMIALLGILKAGGAYIPLDPTYPTERLAFMLDDARVRVVLTSQHARSQLPVTGAVAVCLDLESEVVECRRADRPNSHVTSEDLAYVIYTSGSTGRPKGVMVTHRNVANLFAGMDAHLGRDAAGVWLAMASIAFDISLVELFWTLARGFRVVIAEDKVDPSTVSTVASAAGGPESVADLISKHAVTHMQCTPSMAKMLTMTTGCLEAIGTLRTLILGGEAPPVSLVAKLNRTGLRELFNMYGPTETCIYSTAARLDGAEVSIGRPIANTDVYVLDECQRPTPIGVAGELYIGGAGVARGYLNRPELTADRFLQNPFSSEPAARMYRTGDLVRYSPDGRLEFLGRIDHQVKIRGHRVELEEIESVLRLHPGVRDAVVVAHEIPGALQLVAYLVPGNGWQPEVRELRGFLETKLPEHMIPAAFVPLDRMPLTPSGKIDRRGLPAPTPVRPEDETFQAPRTPIEQRVASLLGHAVGRTKVDVSDNFFELGGNSLSATQIASGIREAFEVDVPLPAFFRAPTVAGLAREVEAQLCARVEPASNRGCRATAVADVSDREPPAQPLPPGDKSPTFSSLVPIQRKGLHPPFFAAHDGLGIGHLYAPLARHLGPDQPFYGLQAQGGVDGREPPYHPCTRIEELAALYLDEVRAVQPVGPYFLGGFCFGGTVAFEMARQLEEQGHRVGLVAVLDTLRDAKEGAPTARNRFQSHWSRMATLRSPDKLSYVVSRVGTTLKYDLAVARQTLRKRTRRVWGEAARAVCVALGRRVPTEAINQCFLIASNRLEKKYVPRPISTRLILFRGADQRSDSTWGWGGLARDGVDVHYVPADHVAMLKEPAVRGLAAILSRSLEEARRNLVMPSAHTETPTSRKLEHAV